jgi:hypothetical protein
MPSQVLFTWVRGRSHSGLAAFIVHHATIRVTESVPLRYSFWKNNIIPSNFSAGGRRHPDTDNRIAIDRLSVEICDRFWPYEKPPVEEFGIDQNRYVQQTRQMLSVPACVRVNFSAADERLAAILYRRGVTLVHLQRAIWLGCARKYVALLNGTEHTPMLVTSMNYFSALVNEVAETSVGEGYWKHMQHKVN